MEENKKYSNEEISQLPLVYMVCVGWYMSRAKKKCQAWYRITNYGEPNQELGESWNTVGSLVTARPGNIFSFPSPNNGETVFSKRGLYVGEWPIEEDRVRWQLESDSKMAMWNADSERRRAVRENLPFRRLAPFHRAYMDLRPSERPFLIAKVLHWIMYGEE